MIQLGICGWCLDVKGVDSVRRARELGFDTMQIGVHSMDDVATLQNSTTQQAYINASNNHQVNIIGLSVSIFDSFSFHAPENETRVREILRHVIDSALAIGMELAYFPAFQVSQIHNSDQMTRSANLLRYACEYVGERPIQLATENTLDIDGHRDLLNQVNDPRLKVLVDAYNPIVFGSRADDQIRGLRDVLVNQVHAKDGHNHVMGSALLGEGEGDFASTVQALKDINFDGYVISETNYDVDTEARVQADVATLRRMLFQN